MILSSAEIPFSKSMLLREAIILSYTDKSIDLDEAKQCDDVVFMSKALEDLKKGKDTFQCGASAAVLRFLSFRISREKGKFVLKGTKRLFERKHDEILDMLSLLGVECELYEDNLCLTSGGWKDPGKAMDASSKISSQFLSALILNSWNLNFDLRLFFDELPSKDYLDMTMFMTSLSGLDMSEKNKVLTIREKSKVTQNAFDRELDLSCVFSLLAFALLNEKELIIEGMPRKTLQADKALVEVFDAMGGEIFESGDLLRFVNEGELKGLDFNLRNCPDLFPVLAVLCAFAKGKSKLSSAPHLKYKESDRVKEISGLLNSIGAGLEERDDVIEITPVQNIDFSKKISFDCKDDHRLAFAAACVKAKGFDVSLVGEDCVSKSFPDFWAVVKKIELDEEIELET